MSLTHLQLSVSPTITHPSQICDVANRNMPLHTTASVEIIAFETLIKMLLISPCSLPASLDWMKSRVVAN